MTTRRDWLLLFLAAGGERATDPIRIMKGMFLHAMESNLSSAEVYQFEPYSYGPFSKQIYADLGALEAAGDVERLSDYRRRWSYVGCTPTGLAHAQQIAGDADQGAVRSIREIRARVDKLSFGQLLTEIYARYPDYAVKSVFQG